MLMGWTDYVATVLPLTYDKCTPGFNDARMLMKRRAMQVGVSYSVMWELVSSLTRLQFVQLGVGEFIEKAVYGDCSQDTVARSRGDCINERLRGGLSVCQTLVKH